MRVEELESVGKKLAWRCLKWGLWITGAMMALGLTVALLVYLLTR